MFRVLFSPLSPRQRLRRAAGAWVALYLLGVLAGYALIMRASAPLPLWLPLALLVAALELWLLFAHLGDNHRPGENALLPRMGAGNDLTLLRGLAYALMAGFLLSPPPTEWLIWVPAILYTFASIGDFFDGYLARRAHHATRLGEVLDMEFDSIGMLLALLLLVGYGKLPLVYLLLGLARFLFIGGLWLRQRWHLPIYPMTESVHRRIVAGAHMGFVTVALWPVLSAQATAIGGLVFGLPIVVSFGRDWLVVIGWLNPASRRYQFWLAQSKRWLLQILPVGWRILAVALTLLALSQGRIPPLLAWVGGVAAVAVLLGLAVRASTLGLIVCALVWLHSAGWNAAAASLLTAASLLVLSGGGWFTFWSPEDRVVYHRLGAQSTPQSSVSLQ